MAPELDQGADAQAAISDGSGAPPNSRVDVELGGTQASLGMSRTGLT